MKIINLNTIIVILLNVSFYKLQIQNITRDISQNNLHELKQYQVGLLNKIPNGPLTQEAAVVAQKDEWERNNGVIKKDQDVGIVYISENLRNKRLGKFRIKSEGLHLQFPTDVNTIKYQDFRDNENFQHYMEENRLNYENNKLHESLHDFNMNPYKDIIEGEKKLISQDIFRVNKDHKKNLMQLALEKEQEIYNNMMKNELEEVKVKKYNRHFYNSAYNFNNENNIK